MTGITAAFLREKNGDVCWLRRKKPILSGHRINNFEEGRGFIKVDGGSCGEKVNFSEVLDQ